MKKREEKRGVIALTATTIAIAALTAIGTGLIIAAIAALKSTVSMREGFTSTADTEACVEDAMMRIFFTGADFSGTYTTNINDTTCTVTVPGSLTNERTIQVTGVNTMGYQKDITVTMQIDTVPYTLISWTEN